MKKGISILLLIVSVFILQSVNGANVEAKEVTNVDNNTVDEWKVCSGDFLQEISELQHQELRKGLVEYNEEMYSHYRNAVKDVYVIGESMYYEATADGDLVHFYNILFDTEVSCDNLSIAGYRPIEGVTIDDGGDTGGSTGGTTTTTTSRDQYIDSSKTTEQMFTGIDSTSWTTLVYGTYSKTYYHESVQVKLYGNTIQINVYVNFTGDTDYKWYYNDNPYDPHDFYTKSVTSALIEGMNYWDGYYTLFGRNTNINVNIIPKTGDACTHSYNYGYRTTHCQEYMNFNFEHDRGRAHVQAIPFLTWFKYNTGGVKMFSKTNSGYTYSYEQVARIAAHELGHILGLDDAYGEEFVFESRDELSGFYDWANDVANEILGTEGFNTADVAEFSFFYRRLEATYFVGPEFKGFMLDDDYAANYSTINSRPSIYKESHALEMEMVLLAFEKSELQSFYSYNLVPGLYYRILYITNYIDTSDWGILNFRKSDAVDGVWID